MMLLVVLSTLVLYTCPKGNEISISIYCFVEILLFISHLNHSARPPARLSVNAIVSNQYLSYEETLESITSNKYCS